MFVTSIEFDVIAQDASAYTDNTTENRLREIFSASVDSFKNSIIVNDVKKLIFFNDELYRTICDSDTYYAYKVTDATIMQVDIAMHSSNASSILQSAINYFSARTDSFSQKILSIAYCALGLYAYSFDSNQSMSYFEASRTHSLTIGDEVFAAYTVLLSSEVYERENMHVEAAVLSRRILDSQMGQTVPMLRFMALLQLYKLYTQMRAYSMVDVYGKMIEDDGFYLTNLNYEVRYLFFKANKHIAKGQFTEAQECSQRLLQISELVSGMQLVWCIYLQAAKIYCYMGEYDEMMYYINICKQYDIYKNKTVFSSLYSSYHVDLYEALMHIKQGRYEDAMAILKRSMPPAKFVKMLEFGTIYYKCLEDIYVSRGDYHNAAKMVQALSQLHSDKYVQHSIQRSGDIDNIYQSDTTIISQDAILIKKNNDISLLKMKLILCALITIVVIILAILVHMLIVRYRRKERENIDIELRERLEREVARQTRQLVQQKNEISNRNTDIRRSRLYARVIQEGVLPDISKFVYPEFSGSFVIYKPADVVSSNIYWYRRFGQFIVVCCADCMETGVPGAMITMVGLTILSDITQRRQSYVASEIVSDFNINLMHMMSDINRRNSMSMSLVVVDTQKHRLNVAASNSKVAMYIGGQMHYVDGDDYYLGVAGEDGEQEQGHFTDTYINYTSGDSVYLYTDSVYSLLGGSQGEKLTERRFAEILSHSVKIGIEHRGEQMEKWLNEWMHNNAQKNDMSIIAFELL